MLKFSLIKALVCSATITSLVASGTTTDTLDSDQLQTLGGGQSQTLDSDQPQTLNSVKLQTLNEAHAKYKKFDGTANTIYHTLHGDMKLSYGKHSVRIKKNSLGGYDAVIGGRNYEFTAADWNAANNQYEKQISRTEKVVFTTSQAASGRRFAYRYTDLFFTGRNKTSTGFVSLQYGNFGIKTQEMPKENNALLYGRATALISPREDKSSYNSLTGKIALSANFSTNKISGKITGIRDAASRKIYPGQLNIKNGAITLNNYKASLSGSQSFNNSIGGTVNGDLQGSFYGPDASETSGTFTLSTPSKVGIGAFLAK